MQGIEKCFRDDKGLVLASLNNFFFKSFLVTKLLRYNVTSINVQLEFLMFPSGLQFFIDFLNAFYNLKFNTKIFLNKLHKIWKNIYLDKINNFLFSFFVFYVIIKNNDYYYYYNYFIVF